MAKAKYMSLEDFQNLWTNKIKPEVVMKSAFASEQTCEDIVSELI